MSAQPWITPGGTISTSPTFNSTLREPTAKPPQPAPFGPPSGLAVLCRPLTTWPSMNAVPPPDDDVIAFGLIIMRNGARNCIRRRICHSFSTRDGLGRCLGIARRGGRCGRRVASGGAMNDAQLHAPAVADIDNPGILVTNPLRLLGSADLVD